jgi:hypothetical protein
VKFFVVMVLACSGGRAEPAKKKGAFYSHRRGCSTLKHLSLMAVTH